MWYENLYVDRARMILGVPLSPLWIASSAAGHEVGMAATPRKGHVFIFGCMCAFVTDASGKRAETALLRVSYDKIESVTAEGEFSLRITSNGGVFKLTALEERAVVLNAMQWLMVNHSHSDDLNEIERSHVLYPEATKKIRTLARHLPEAEYVLQDIDGAIVTNHRLFFATTVVRLSQIHMMHVGDDDLKIIINKDLIVQLRCSQQRQTLVSSVWLAALPVWTDMLDRVARDPQKALKAHVKTLQRLHRQFCAIDESRDGLLSKQEVCDAIGCLFNNTKFVDGFFLALDNDNSGEISLLEFLNGISRLIVSDLMGRIRFSFKMFDTDRSGSLDRSEFFSALCTLSSTGDVNGSDEALHAICDELFSLMDVDHSGSISLEEYTTALLENSSVHSLFRRIGLYGGADFFKLKLSEEPLCIASPQWRITAAVMQALQVGLNASKTDVMSAVVPADFVATVSCPLNVDAEVVREYGSPCQHPTASTQWRIEVSAPKIFERIRSIFDIRLKYLRHSLGIDNLLGNMLLGSSTLPQWEAPLYGSKHHFKFVTHDDLFVIRNISPEEKARLVLMLPHYMSYITSCPNTLLQRWLGLFSVFANNYQLHFVLQLNVARPLTPPAAVLCFHAANYKAPLPPDGIDANELRAPVFLFKGWRDPLLRQVKKDVSFLVSQSLCDFSLIAAVPRIPVPAGKRNDNIEFAKALRHAASMPPEKKWSCCSSAVKERESLSAALVASSDAESVVSLSPLDSSPSFRQSKGRASYFGGLFYSFECGVPTDELRCVTFSFVNLLTTDANRSAAYGAALLKELGQLVQGADEDTGKVVKDATCRFYPVTTETGQQAAIGIDHPHKQLYVVGTQRQLLLGINFVLASSSLSFCRDLQCYSERSRRKVMIRCGMERGSAGCEFRTRFGVSFENIAAREMFLSEAQEAVFGDARAGVHVKKLKVFSVTWNVGERVPGDLSQLLEQSSQCDCDIVAVHCQDCSYPVHGGSSCHLDWVSRLATQLRQYDIVSSVSIWSTRTVVFVRRCLAPCISNVVKSKTGSFLGNCNAVGIGFKLFESALCFINARFAQRGDEGSSTEDYFDTMDGLSELEGEGIGALATYHHVYFAGDLKYRSKATLQQVIDASNSKCYDQISKTDQLLCEMSLGDAFFGFSEGPLDFRPTTKFLAGLSSADGRQERAYDEWKDEVPSWSHRILYRSLGHPIDEGRCLRYDADLTVTSSTCAPVFAVHELSIRLQTVVPTHVERPVTSVVVSSLSCTNLLKSELCKVCDPWVKFLCPFFAQPSSQTRTHVLSGTRNPSWEGAFDLPVVPCDISMFASDYLHFAVYDEDFSGQKDLLGVGTLSLDTFASSASTRCSLPLLLAGKKNGLLTAIVEIRFGE